MSKREASQEELTQFLKAVRTDGQAMFAKIIVGMLTDETPLTFKSFQHEIDMLREMADQRLDRVGRAKISLAKAYLDYMLHDIDVFTKKPKTRTFPRES